MLIKLQPLGGGGHVEELSNNNKFLHIYILIICILRNLGGHGSIIGIQKNNDQQNIYIYSGTHRGGDIFSKTGKTFRELLLPFF